MTPVEASKSARNSRGAAAAGTRLIRPGPQTAFVLGNGPSLEAALLPALSDFTTIGMNAAYRYWRKIDWRPTHYACLDLVVGLSHKDEIAALIDEGRIGAFLLRENLIEALGEVARTPRVVSFDALAARHDLFSDPHVTTGAGAALWAAHTGHRDIVLLGVDARYTEVVDGAARRAGTELEIVTQAGNPNYFFEDYQQPGDRYNVPNPRPALHVESWRAAGRKLQAAGVAVYNANERSAVRCFPFVDLGALMGAGAAIVPADETLTDASPSASADAASHAKLARARAFVTENIRVVAAVLTAGAVLFALMSAARFTLLGVIGAAAVAGAMTAFALGLAHMRTTMSAHIGRLHRENALLRARIADLERQNLRPSNAPGNALSPDRHSHQRPAQSDRG